METVFAVLAGIVGIIAALLKVYLSDKSEKPKENPYEAEHNKKVEEFDTALAEHNDDQLSAMLNELCVPVEDSKNKSSGDSCRQNSENITKRQL